MEYHKGQYYIGPLLFLLYTIDIQNCTSDCSIKLFADNTNVFVHGKSLDEVIAKANKSLALLSKWFTANKLSLSVDKTSYSVFGKPDDKKHLSILIYCTALRFMQILKSPF